MHRKLEVKDIVTRLGLVGPSSLKIKDFPRLPSSVFNPGCIVNERKGEVNVFARISPGYFSYSNAIVKFSLPYPLRRSTQPIGAPIEAEIALAPNNEYDFWGCEDPRVYRLEDSYFMTYTGRAVGYSESEFFKAMAITASSPDLENWKVQWVLWPTFKTVHCKNAFLLQHRGNVWYFYRVRKQKSFSLRVSKLRKMPKKTDRLTKISLPKGKEVLSKEPWERKIGWCAPPVKIKDDKLLAFVHSVDSKLRVYRIFAVLLDDKTMEPLEITPKFIMAPKTIYEKFGDRPYVVFPCGTVKVNDTIFISYGAADSFCAFAEVGVNDVLSEMVPV